jgi:CheY-like chemotaxis protein
MERARESYKLLVVDDEAHNLDFVSRVFRSPHQVLTALSGEAALELLQQHPDVAVVIADQRMPGMNGSELLSRTQEIAPRAMRVLMTGYADFESVVDAINRGKVWSYVSKPVSADHLKKVVESSLEIFSLSRRNEALMAEMESNNQRLVSTKGELEASLDIQTQQLLESNRKLQEVAHRYALPGLYDHPTFSDPRRPVRIELDIEVRVDVLPPPSRELLAGTAAWEQVSINSEKAGLIFDGRIRDLAENAARIATDVQVPLLSRVALTFPLEGIPRAVVLGLVVSRGSQPVEVPRKSGPPVVLEPGFGVFFEAVPLAVRQAIIGVIQSQGTR